jgi:hypothetical protein
MARNKQNLLFVVGAVVALAFIGWVAFCSFSGSNHNTEGTGDLKTADARSGEHGLPVPGALRPAAAVTGTSRTDDSPTLMLRCRAVIPSHVSSDAETAIAYALQKELQASTNLFDPQATKFGPEIHRDREADTFTFDVALALKRPIKL